MLKTVLVNHSERSSVPKKIQESYRIGRDSDREPTMNSLESAVAAVITCHNCKRPWYEKKDCNQLNKRPYKSGNLENIKNI